MTETGAQRLIAVLKRRGVDHLFGIPGVHTLPLYDALYAEPAIRAVVVRHENGASCAADGFARVTRRAAVCAECHVGGEGRDVTHAMMAAGHPPLAFSLPRFLHDMPPHWKKPDASADLSAWVEGAKAAGAARLRQVERMAQRGAAWPEFGAFDCYACHHEIRGGGAERAVAPGLEHAQQLGLRAAR